MRQFNCFVFLFLLFMAGIISAAPLTPGKVGVNLVSDGAFVNVANETNRYNNVAAFDAQGWPMDDFELVLMDNRPATEWTGDIDDPEEYRIDYSGLYKAAFNGQATLQVMGGFTITNQQYNSAANRTTFDLTVNPVGANHCFVMIGFTNTKRTAASAVNTGITNLKAMRPGYALDSTQTFTTQYINLCKTADFACYRYYTMQNIWAGDAAYPAELSWTNRKLPTDASQDSMESTTGKTEAWCWEYIIELANILDRDIWICIHTSASSSYITSLAQKLKNELHSGINIYVENSNEVWSATWNENGPWNNSQATARGITFNQNYARRCVEISNLFSGVFGSTAINNRIRVICAGQAGWIGRNEEHLAYINTTYGPPKNYIYAISAAHYFTTTAPSGTVAEINTGMLAEIDSQLGSDASDRPQHIALAATWELPGGCTSYEGGPHVPAGGGTTDLDNQILAHRTTAMRNVMVCNLKDGWVDIGGGLALQFTISSGYNRYGCWGLTDDWTKPFRNHKMMAMIDLLGAWTGDGMPEGSDTDTDGMDDFWEAAHGLDPMNDDTGLDPDGDGLTNVQEFGAATDPQDVDTDGDGLEDGDEVNIHATDPTLVDTDGDGLSDYYEVNTSGTNPTDSDSDGDGMLDGWEDANGLDPTVNDASGDLDSDGLSNLAEQAAGTDPQNADTDNDGLLDGEDPYPLNSGTPSTSGGSKGCLPAQGMQGSSLALFVLMILGITRFA